MLEELAGPALAGDIDTMRNRMAGVSDRGSMFLADGTDADIAASIAAAAGTGLARKNSWSALPADELLNHTDEWIIAVTSSEVRHPSTTLVLR